MLHCLHQVVFHPMLEEHGLPRVPSGTHGIGGAFGPAVLARQFAVRNPASGEKLADAAESDAADGDPAATA